VTYRWDIRDRKRAKKNALKQMNSFSEYTDYESEEAKERSRKKKLLKKQEEELLDAFDKKDN
jgi:hypothetical protein